MVFKDEFIVVGNSICELSGDCTRIALIAIGRDKLKTDGGRLFRNNSSGPNSLVETLKATMESIGAIVNSKLVILTVNSELTLTNTIKPAR